LTVSYGRHADSPVLKSVALNLKGEKSVIVGPNGSGKSTLFKAVLGLAPIQSGSVKVFGTDVRQVRGDIRTSTNLAEVYRLAYVKTRDIVGIFAELKSGSPEAPLKMFHDFELDSILKKKIHELSTGQQKMFGNILAVSFSPKLVLLDEPFDNVDESRRRRFIDVLKDLDSEIVIITHEFNLLSRLSDWALYFMMEGKLWGKFFASQLDRLYITRGEAKDALAVMDTSLGKLSVTLDHGDIAVKTATNLNALLEQV
ncbi:MAG: ATP-binding cassette domain-containing protein, partial [Nitrososphaerales archaeon]